MKAMQLKAKYGEVKEISAVDYVDEVNKAGDEVWVVLHLFQQGYPLPQYHKTMDVSWYKTFTVHSILSKHRVGKLLSFYFSCIESTQETS